MSVGGGGAGGALGGGAGDGSTAGAGFATGAGCGAGATGVVAGATSGGAEVGGAAAGAGALPLGGGAAGTGALEAAGGGALPEGLGSTGKPAVGGVCDQAGELAKSVPAIENPISRFNIGKRVSGNGKNDRLDAEASRARSIDESTRGRYIFSVPCRRSISPSSAGPSWSDRTARARRHAEHCSRRSPPRLAVEGSVLVKALFDRWLFGAR